MWIRIFILHQGIYGHDLINAGYCLNVYAERRMGILQVWAEEQTSCKLQALFCFCLLCQCTGCSALTQWTGSCVENCSSSCRPTGSTLLVSTQQQLALLSSYWWQWAPYPSYLPKMCFAHILKYFYGRVECLGTRLIIRCMKRHSSSCFSSYCRAWRLIVI